MDMRRIWSIAAFFIGCVNRRLHGRVNGAFKRRASSLKKRKRTETEQAHITGAPSFLERPSSSLTDPLKSFPADDSPRLSFAFFFLHLPPPLQDLRARLIDLFKFGENNDREDTIEAGDSPLYSYAVVAVE